MPLLPACGRRFIFLHCIVYSGGIAFEGSHIIGSGIYSEPDHE